MGEADLRPLVEKAARERNLDPELIYRQIQRESSWNPRAVSPKGARGLMQLMPATAARFNVADPFNAEESIRGGTTYMRELMDRYQNDPLKALAAYNAGEGAVDKYGGIPPFEETQTYVQSIMEGYQSAPAPKDLDAFARQLGGQVTPTSADTTAASTPSLATPSPSSIPPAHRFLAEAVQAGIVEPTVGLVSLARGMWDDPVGTAAAVAKSIGVPVIEGLQEATAARERGDAGAWTRGMVKAVPLIGPVADQILDSIEAGDYAGAAGRGVGTAATFFVPKALGRIKATKATGPVPLLRAERTPGGVPGFVTALSERTTPGARVFAKFREKQQAALQAEGERLAGEISALKRTGTDVGSEVRRMVDQSREQAKDAARPIYDMIDAQVATQTKRVPVTRDVPSRIVGPQGEALTVPERTLQKVEVGGVQPETKVLKDVAIPMLRKIRQESKLIHPDELSRTTKLLEQIIRSPHRIPFSAMQSARSSLLGIVRSHGDPIPGKAGGAAKLLAGAVDDAMLDAASQSGIAGLPEMVREANALWRDAKTIYNARFLKNIGTASPETIPALIQSADLAELGLLKGALPPKTWDAARAHLMREMVSDAISSPPTPTATTFAAKFGITPAGKPPVAPRFDGKKLTTRLRSLGTEKSEFLFGRTGVDGLDDLAGLAERVQPGAVNRAATGLIAAGLNASILAPFMGPLLRPSMFLSPAAMAASSAYAATAYGSLNLLARILTKPEGMTTYRRFLRGLSTDNRPLMIAAGLRLGSLYEADQKDQGKENDLLTAQAQPPGDRITPTGTAAR